MSGLHGAPANVPLPLPSCNRILKTPPHIASSKPGPMKATIPISGVIKPICSSSRIRSPILIEPPSTFSLASSPNRYSSASWWSRTSSPGGEQPHQQTVSGQRSPGSSSTYYFKDKSKMNSDLIRRTASLDTIYLKGQWPRDNHGYYWGSLQVDKATQTDEIDSMKDLYCLPQQTESANINIRPTSRCWSIPRESSRLTISPSSDHVATTTCSDTSSQTCASSFYHQSPHLRNSLTLKPLPKTSSSIRSSVEGLNQEIERIVLQTETDIDRNIIRQNTPEGHRAPLAELLRYNASAAPKGRSVNTQTPQDFSSQSSSGTSSHRNSPLLFQSNLWSDEEYLATSAGGSSPDNEAMGCGSGGGISSGGSSTKLGTSPQINRFLAREPPDGCEKVRLKSLDNEQISEHLRQRLLQPQQQHNIVVAPQPSTFKLKPSLGSAFKILQPKLSPSEEEQVDFPVVQERDGDDKGETTEEGKN